MTTERSLGVFAVLLGVGTTPMGGAPETVVVGDGTAASCTEAAFDAELNKMRANAEGSLTFNCGGDKFVIPVT